MGPMLMDDYVVLFQSFSPLVVSKVLAFTSRCSRESSQEDVSCSLHALFIVHLYVTINMGTGRFQSIVCKVCITVTHGLCVQK